MNEIKIKSSIKLQNNELHDIVAVVNLNDDEIVKKMASKKKELNDNLDFTNNLCSILKTDNELLDELSKNKNFRLKIKGKVKKRINNNFLKEYYEKDDILNNKPFEQDININPEFKKCISRNLKNFKGVKFYGKIKKVNDRTKHFLKHSQNYIIQESPYLRKQTNYKLTEECNKIFLRKINNICSKVGNQINNLSSFIRIKKKTIQKKKNIKKCKKNKLITNLRKIKKDKIMRKKWNNKKKVYERKESSVYSLKEGKSIKNKKQTEKLSKINQSPLSIRLNYEKNKLYFNCLFKNIKNKDKKEVLNDISMLDKKIIGSKSVCEIEEFVKNNKYVMKKNIKNIYNKKKDSNVYSCNNSIYSRKNNNYQNKRNSCHKYEETFMSLSENSENSENNIMFENESIDKDINFVYPLQNIEENEKKYIKYINVIRTYGNRKRSSLLNNTNKFEIKRNSKKLSNKTSLYLDNNDFEKQKKLMKKMVKDENQNMSIFLKFYPLINKEQINTNNILCYNTNQDIDINNIEFLKYNIKRESLISIHSEFSRNKSINEIDDDSKYYSNYNFEKKKKLSFMNKSYTNTIFKNNPNKIENYKIEKKTKSLSVVNILDKNKPENKIFIEKNKIKHNSLNSDKKLLTLNMSNIIDKTKEIDFINSKFSNNFLGSRNRSGPTISKRNVSIKNKYNDIKFGKNKMNENEQMLIGDNITEIKSINGNMDNNNPSFKNLNINNKPNLNNKNGEVKNDEIKNDEIKNDEIKNDEIKNDEIKNDEIKNDEIKNDEIKESAEKKEHNYNKQNNNIEFSENNKMIIKVVPKVCKSASKGVVVKNLVKKYESKNVVKQNVNESKKKEKDVNDNDATIDEKEKSEHNENDKNNDKFENCFKKINSKSKKSKQVDIQQTIEISLKDNDNEKSDENIVAKNNINKMLVKKMMPKIPSINKSMVKKNVILKTGKKETYDTEKVDKDSKKIEENDPESNSNKNVKNVECEEKTKSEINEMVLNKTKLETEKCDDKQKVKIHKEICLKKNAKNIPSLKDLKKEKDKNILIKTDNNINNINERKFIEKAVKKNIEKMLEKEEIEKDEESGKTLDPTDLSLFNRSETISKIMNLKLFSSVQENNKSEIVKNSQNNCNPLNQENRNDAIKRSFTFKSIEKMSIANSEKEKETREPHIDKGANTSSNDQEQNTSKVPSKIVISKKLTSKFSLKSNKNCIFKGNVEAVEKVEKNVEEIEQVEKKVEAVEKIEEKNETNYAEHKKKDNCVTKKSNILKDHLKAKMACLSKRNVEKALIKKNNFIKKLNTIKNILPLKELPIKNGNNVDTKNMNENIKTDENKNGDIQLDPDSIETDNTSVLTSSGNLDTAVCLINNSTKPVNSVNTHEEQIKNESNNEDKKINENINHVPSKPIIKIVPKFPKNVVSIPIKINLTKDVDSLKKIAKTKPPMLSKYKPKAA
ncbi:conserved Plasmodium protein, unknown function [Plasmodium berghei ANKA]|uniref:Uncharacterized protein n=1 Tax=Plasmodium berghei (strain Anka) TaxID=5823 RepID=A0A509AG79_PLABA|nr:conserved Plasmodium protein, unknown function [Plasmodium berghei ANKA]VUC54520.1 conserved Plasmodium protein, unknown function [Plasmodium berghei ANKA]|eukprot:XP_034420349.1 conserved Plasmodium protein, unknown function [Plasmodium berghei ANKA]